MVHQLLVLTIHAPGLLARRRAERAHGPFQPSIDGVRAETQELRLILASAVVLGDQPHRLALLIAEALKPRREVIVHARLRTANAASSLRAQPAVWPSWT